VNSIGKLITLCADLAEAEGRLLRTHVVRVAVVLALIVAVLMLGVGAAALLISALYMVVAEALGAPAGLAVCGGVALILAGVIAWLIRRIPT